MKVGHSTLRAGGQTDVTTKNFPAMMACGMAIAAVIVFGVWLRWDALTMAVGLDKLAGLLSPIAFAAVVVERGLRS